MPNQFLKFFTSFALTASITTAAFAETERQAWSSVNLSTSLKESPYSVAIEGIYRHSITEEKTVVSSLRAFVNYQWTEPSRISLFYENRKGETNSSSEQRFAQQIQTRFNFEKFDLGLRWRQEQRLFETETAWLHRSRLQLRGDLKNNVFTNTSPVISNEILYLNNSLGSRSAGSLENRVFLGLNSKWNEGKSRAEYGIMDRRSFVKSEETRSEILVLNLSFVL